jgi:hypothetical protein
MARQRGYDGEKQEQHEMREGESRAEESRVPIPSLQTSGGLRRRLQHIAWVYGHTKLFVLWTAGSITVLKTSFFVLDKFFPDLPIAVVLADWLTDALRDWKIFIIAMLLIALLAFWESSYRIHNPKKLTLTAEEEHAYSSAHSGFYKLPPGGKLALRQLYRRVSTGPEYLIGYLRKQGFSEPERDVATLIDDTGLVRTTGRGGIEIFDFNTKKAVKKLLDEEPMFPDY